MLKFVINQFMCQQRNHYRITLHHHMYYYMHLVINYHIIQIIQPFMSLTDICYLLLLSSLATDTLFTSPIGMLTGPTINNDIELIMNDIRAQIPSSRVIGLSSAKDLNTYYGMYRMYLCSCVCYWSTLFIYMNTFCIDTHDDGTTTNGTIKAGIVFDLTNGTLPLSITYTIRLNGSDLPDTSKYLGDDDHGTPYATPEDDQYEDTGYVRLQYAINEAIIALRFNQSMSSMKQGSSFERESLSSYQLLTQFQRLPVAAWFNDPFHDNLVNIGSLYLVVGFYPIVTKLLQNLVLEKERRTREGMKMMVLLFTLDCMSLSSSIHLTCVHVGEIGLAINNIKLRLAYNLYFGNINTNRIYLNCMWCCWYIQVSHSYLLSSLPSAPLFSLCLLLPFA
jgi:hypothetical protein